MLPDEKKSRAVVRLVDDDPTVLRALSVFLEMADWRVRAFQSGADFLASDLSEPGCAVLDVRMPGMTGIELQREMNERGVDLPVIFLSAHGDIEMAVEAIKHGARTFLVKPPDTEKLLAEIEGAVEANFERRRSVAWARSLQASWDGLTPAEQQVASMAAKGLTTSVIAEVLGVAERTVKSQRASILEKLELANAVELADFVHELHEAEVLAGGVGGRS
ncbi:response regulator [uncultured Sutterella sp.]|uniref:response regulator transcription factor n=1 Tax=uncultured Sutterella sp. TaxID=286133 RepID=UPI0025CF73FD|nr:response regulator [uncultured Sutterella sp.]